jgi:hypothetical protein
VTGPSDGGLFEFAPVGDHPGPMEARAVELLAALAPASPILAGYGAALLVAGRNVDRAEATRDSGKVDRALGRWVELLGRLTLDQAPRRDREGGESGDDRTEFDRYAAAVGRSNGGALVGDAP